MSARAFDSRKACALGAADASPKGSIDAPIAAHVSWLNSSCPDWCTTSSCSGRVTLYAHAPGGVTKGGKWLHISHDAAVAGEVEAALVGDSPQWTAPGAGDVVLRFEPFIMTCACATLEAARTLVRAAVAAGLRESGLLSWPLAGGAAADSRAGCVVTVRGSLRLEVPVVLAGRRLISPEALEALVGCANSKFAANAVKTQLFFTTLHAALAPVLQPSGDEAVQHRGKGRACNSCGLAGHLAAACPQRAARTRGSSSPAAVAQPASEAAENGGAGHHSSAAFPLERSRFKRLVQPHEVVAHLRAGSGDMALSTLEQGGGAHVIAFEWRPEQLQALRAAVAALPAHLASRVTVVGHDPRLATGESQHLRPHIAHRVVLPDSDPAWLAPALRLVRLISGGVLHIPVPSGDDAAQRTCDAIRAAAFPRPVAARVAGSGAPHASPEMPLLMLDIAVEQYSTAWLQMAHSCGGRRTLPSVACPNRAAFLCAVPAVAAPGRPFSQEPVHLTQLACIARAVERWSPEHMASEGGSTPTSCHVSTDHRGFDLAGHKPKGAAQARNFAFVELPFSEAICRCNGTSTEPPLLGPEERVYIRTVGSSPRAHVPDVLPSLAADVDLMCSDGPDALSSPGLVPPAQYHSSCLRLAGPATRLFCHYDTADNVLMQVTGDKHVLLFPPSQMHNLYVSGSAARVPPDLLLGACGVDCDADGVAVAMAALEVAWPRALLALPHRRHVRLTPGTGVHIPALWLHCIATPASCAFSAGLNVFFNMSAPELYDPQDAYGNKDPPKAVAWQSDVAKVAKAMSQWPQPWRGVYATACAHLLLALKETDEAEEAG
jgi:tRNA wybutosine-synthesizing protein 3